MEYVIAPGYDIVKFTYGIHSPMPRRYCAEGWECKKLFNNNNDYSNKNIEEYIPEANIN
ncbi:MAG: hypothetical protein FWC95_03720 [Defluviitaleaceae bacterium]|nr:hypothetical protein [Defluviitaleaceae bacterium]